MLRQVRRCHRTHGTATHTHHITTLVMGQDGEHAPTFERCYRYAIVDPYLIWGLPAARRRLLIARWDLFTYLTDSDLAWLKDHEWDGRL